MVEGNLITLDLLRHSAVATGWVEWNGLYIVYGEAEEALHPYSYIIFKNNLLCLVCIPGIGTEDYI